MLLFVRGGRILMKHNETEKIKKMLEILTPEQKDELIKSLQKIILSDETASLSFFPGEDL